MTSTMRKEPPLKPKSPPVQELRKEWPLRFWPNESDAELVDPVCKTSLTPPARLIVPPESVTELPEFVSARTTVAVPFVTHDASLLVLSNVNVPAPEVVTMDAIRLPEVTV